MLKSCRSSTWPVIDLRQRPSVCPRLDVHAVYLGTPGPHPACPAGLLGRTEAVMIGPIRQESTDVRGATDHPPGLLSLGPATPMRQGFLKSLLETGRALAIPTSALHIEGL